MNTATQTIGSAAPISKFNRHSFIRWLRKTHSWIGLWGAVLGLLFGTSGILLNHRAVMKIPAAQSQESNVQLSLPDPAPENVNDLAKWVQQQLALEQAASRKKEEPSRTVAWGDKALKQPEHWMITFASPKMNVQADYWVGNNVVNVKRADANFFAVLNNLHKGTGMGVGWVLLADTMAGSILLLSLTGVILWTQLNRRRLVGVAIMGVSLTTMLLLAFRAV